MEIKRNNRFYNTFCPLTSALVNFTYSVKYEDEENIPKEGPALLLPKHQSLWDVLLEGDLLRRHGRFGNWVMKSSLPGIFEYGGGIPITRPKDVLKERKYKLNGKDILKQRHKPKNNRGAGEYIEFLCREGEIVIVHPEGTRVRNSMGKIRGIKNGPIDHVRRVERNFNISIPAIPIGIEYENQEKIGSEVIVRVGEPLDLDAPDLENIVRKEIQKLSGFDNSYKS